MQNIVLSPIPLNELKTVIGETVKNEFAKQAAAQPPTKEYAEFLTRKETAKLLTVSLPTLSEWTKRGLITGYRISCRVRYKRSEVETALKQIISLKKHGR